MIPGSRVGKICLLPVLLAWCLSESAHPRLGAAETEAPSKFDVSREIETLIPKRETGVLEFLKEHPTYDGRGVVIAVFDTGVDPSAPGLQVTTTGEPKIVDLIDASGSGDVDTSMTVKRGDDGTLPGRSGRKLTLPEDLRNTNNLFHIGVKTGEELFHGGVLSRIRADRRRDWDQKRRELMSERREQEKAAEKAGRRPSLTKAENELTFAERDLLARGSLLEKLEKGHDGYDPGPVYDCVVWNDGKNWNVLVDTDEDGDLRDEKLLRPFGVSREYASFGKRVACHFSVQVFEEGKRLSLVTVSGSHGTHVAAIASAHFPDEPARNGIAPGARILSIKIGDVRMDGSSSGVGELRAVAACARYKADIMNASWGGQSVYQDGRSLICQLYTRLVEEYGVVAFVSAGNNGPALSTLGSPGGETPAVIGVGAYVSKEMARALYAVAGETPDTAFNFSSRGPAKGGYLGVDIMGPGAATAPVSFDTLARVARMNGTSMSSPSVAGVGALLVSAAKQLKIPVTPPRIKAALMNGAKQVEGLDAWAQGAGLAQVGAAFEHLQRAKDIPGFDLQFIIRTDDNPLQAGPGLYWRNGMPPGAHEVEFDVTPRFLSAASLDQKFNLEHDIILETTEPWIKVPRYLHLTSDNQSFRPIITVPDPDDTLNGKPLYAEIHGLLADHPDAGPLFRIPITIIQPTRPDSTSRPAETFSATLQPGEESRHYYLIPANVTHMRLRLRRNAGELNSRQYIVHALSLASTRSFGTHEVKSNVRLDPGEERDLWIEVLPGRTTELVLHQLWSSLGSSELQAEIEFHGLHARQAALHLAPNQKYTTLDLYSSLGDLTVEVNARITDAVYRHLPKEWAITPLDDTDAFPAGPQETGPTRQFALRQKFELNLERATSLAIQTDRFAAVDEELAGGMMSVFNSNGKLLWQGSGRGRRGNALSLPKGKITVHREVRALDLQFLEQEKDRPLLVQRAVSAEPTLAVAADGPSALRGRRGGATSLKQDRDYSFHFQNAALAGLKDITPAPAYFQGEVRVMRSSNTLLRLPLTYLRGEELSDPKRPPGSDSKPLKQPPLVKLDEEIFTKKLELIRSLRHKRDTESVSACSQLLAELREKKPQHAPLYYEEAIILASAHKLLSRWHTAAATEDTATPPKAAADGKEADQPEAPIRRRRRPASALEEFPPGFGTPQRRGNEHTTEASTEGTALDDDPPKSEPEVPSDKEPSKDEDQPKEEEAADKAKDPLPAPEKIFEQLEEALKLTDADRVARFFGATPVPPPEDAAARQALERERKERSTERDFLRDVHLLRSDVLMHQEKFKEARSALLESRRWEATPTLPARKSREQEMGILEKEGHFGLALQMLDDQFLKDDPADRRLREQRAGFYRKLGWNFWAEREQFLMTLEKNQTQPRL